MGMGRGPRARSISRECVYWDGGVCRSPGERDSNRQAVPYSAPHYKASQQRIPDLIAGQQSQRPKLSMGRPQDRVVAKRDHPALRLLDHRGGAGWGSRPEQSRVTCLCPPSRCRRRKRAVGTEECSRHFVVFGPRFAFVLFLAFARLSIDRSIAPVFCVCLLFTLESTPTLESNRSP